MDEASRAFVLALKLLTRRDHGEAELAGKLGLRGIEEAAVQAAIDRCRQLGYLDDRRFAEQWAEAAVRNGRGYGPKIALELRRRGIDRALVAEVVTGIAAAHDEEAAVADLLARKFAGFDPDTADLREKRRVMDWLRRRGFSVGAILNCFRQG